MHHNAKQNQIESNREKVANLYRVIMGGNPGKVRFERRPKVSSGLSHGHIEKKKSFVGRK